jgi:mannose-6-phosphate isomerase-like protein (cupin superfamily)
MHIITSEDLSADGGRFEGAGHGVAISAFVVDGAPGGGPRLHMHPYAEIFVLQQGRISVTVGDETVDAEGPQVIIAPPDTPHRFTNLGPGRALMVNIHTAETMTTEWLE